MGRRLTDAVSLARLIIFISHGSNISIVFPRWTVDAPDETGFASTGEMVHVLEGDRAPNVRYRDWLPDHCFFNFHIHGSRGCRAIFLPTQ